MANQKYKSDAEHCTEKECSWKNIHSLLDTQAEYIKVVLLLKAIFMEVFIPLILQLTKKKRLKQPQQNYLLQQPLALQLRLCWMPCNLYYGKNLADNHKNTPSFAPKLLEIRCDKHFCNFWK